MNNVNKNYNIMGEGEEYLIKDSERSENTTQNNCMKHYPVRLNSHVEVSKEDLESDTETESQSDDNYWHNEEDEDDNNKGTKLNCYNNALRLNSHVEVSKEDLRSLNEEEMEEYSELVNDKETIKRRKASIKTVTHEVEHNNSEKLLINNEIIVDIADNLPSLPQTKKIKEASQNEEEKKPKSLRVLDNMVSYFLYAAGGIVTSYFLYKRFKQY
jgi:hypothetical protein